MKRTTAAIVLSVLFLASQLPASAGPSVSITLENGLDLVMMPDASSPLISCLVVIRTGSGYETLATAGSTHLLEHMLFRGTAGRTQDEIYDALDLMGAYNNAQTGKTYTNFILVTPREHAREAMEIQADMILHSTIPEEDFEEEKGRVINEIRQSMNRASYQAELAHMRNVYGNTSYSFPTLGSVEGIRAIGHDTVVRFYRDWYAVNNMTLVIRGDLGYAEMERLAREVYGSEPARELPVRPESWPVGFDDWHSGSLHISHGKISSGFLQISMPAPRFDDPDYPAFELIQQVLDDRLEADLRAIGAPLTFYVYSSITADPNFNVLNITAGLMPGADPEDVLEIILSGVQAVSETDISDDDIRHIVEKSQRSELFFAEQVQYGSFLLVPKLALAPYGFWETFDRARDQLYTETVIGVASRWFAEPIWVASALLPPAEAETGAGITLGELAADTLDNGLVILARQVSGAPVAGIHLIAKHRSLWESSGCSGYADLLHRMLRQGSGMLDADELELEMDRIGMELQTVDDPRVPMDNYRTTPEYGFLRIQVVAGNWREALVLLADLIADPRFDEQTIADGRTELLGVIKDRTGTVAGNTRRQFAEHLYGGHTLALDVYGDGSNLETVDASSLAELHSGYFGADNLIISILCPSEASEVFSVARHAFGRLQRSQGAPASTTAPKSITGTVEVKGRGRQGMLATGFLLRDVPREDRAALLVANAMISDQIYRDLGEARGWAYGAGSSLSFRGDWGAWSSTIGLPVEHLAEAHNAVYTHLARIARGDFDKHRMEVARNYLLGRTLRRYSSRINLAMALGHDAFIHGDPLYTWSLYEQIRGVAYDSVKRAAKKHLSKPKGAVAVLGKPDPDAKPYGPPRGMGDMGMH